MKTDHRMYRVDRAKLDRLILQHGLTQEQFAAGAKIGRRTLFRMLNGHGSFLSTIKKVAKFFGIEDITELLAPEEFEADRQLRSNGRGRVVGDWEALKAIGPWETASNSLQYRVHRMAHLHLSETFGRGKCYDLSALPEEARQQFREQLERHPKVCRRLSPSTHVAVNSTALPDRTDGNWWVVDEWVEGTTLADCLQTEKGVEAEAAPGILRGIAEGLVALHDRDIVRRELSPNFVILREETLRPVLTDFELAKLLDAERTVSNRHHWRIDPYRAPEVSAANGDVDVRADLYSWGRIAVHVLCGTLPVAGKEGDALSKVSLPSGVADIILACVRKPRSERPNQMADVTRVLKGWGEAG